MTFETPNASAKVTMDATTTGFTQNRLLSTLIRPTHLDSQVSQKQACVHKHQVRRRDELDPAGRGYH